MPITRHKPNLKLPSPQHERVDGPHSRRVDLGRLQMHVRRFEHSFEDAHVDERVPYETLGPWAAEIGYTLFLLADNLEAEWIIMNDPEQVELACGLHRFSGYWTFLQAHTGQDLDGIWALCGETLRLISLVRQMVPGYPCDGSVPTGSPAE